LKLNYFTSGFTAFSFKTFEYYNNRSTCNWRGQLFGFLRFYLKSQKSKQLPPPIAGGSVVVILKSFEGRG
jgi:hypothetical protein